MNEDFLLEIGTEEIPAGWLEKTSTQLSDKISALFSKEEVSYDKIENFSTPRRIAVLIKNVTTKQDDKSVEITGPPKEVAFDKSDNLTKAGLGFANAHKVSPSEIKVKSKGKQEVIYCQKLIKGKKTSEILESALPNIISKIEFPKSMRWESSGFRFARPIRWIVALLGKNIITFEVASAKSGKESQGLRFTPPIIIKSADSYEKTLEENDIIVNFIKRRELIIQNIQDLKKNLFYVGRIGLYDEVTNLVECPKAILGEFDEKYLKLPKEVITTAMDAHQRYFALTEKDGKLAPYFIVVANTKDGDIDKIRKGNERVLRARLADAEFYFDEDMKIPLKERIPELKEVIWQEGLGTLYDKTQRLIELSEYIAKIFIQIHVNLKILREATELCKVDLLTNMIKDGKEFTKLEGLYGSILAEKQGLDSMIVDIMKGRTGNPDIETSPEGVALAIADRIDAIAGAFVLGKIPTGSKDPLGIRRVGNELVSIIMESSRFVNALRISLKSLISKTLNIYEKVQNVKFEAQEEKIFEFLIKRFRKYLEDKGIRYDIIDAVLEIPNNDLVDLLAKVNALNELKDKKDFITLIHSAKRIRNILKSSELKVENKKCRKELLKEPAEIKLYNTLISEEKEFENSIEQKDYKSALSWLFNRAFYINDFFDKVLVMTKETDVRENRIALLNETHLLFQKIADFSKITE